MKDVRTLIYISISTNNITDIPNGTFRGFPELAGLILDRNPLRNLNREGLLAGVEPTLKLISLKDMGLKTFPSKLIRNLKKLNWVILNDNDIICLRNDMFEGFQSTTPLRVYLERNRISSIDPYFLRGSTFKLRKLDLSENRLTTLYSVDHCLPAFQYNFTDVPPHVHAEDNPLFCGCDLLNLANQENFTITGTCRYPAPYHGMTLYDSLHQSYNETGVYGCPLTDPIDCTSGCDNLMTSSLLIVAYVTIIYVTVEWMA